jgi:hypothetical protein
MDEGVRPVVMYSRILIFDDARKKLTFAAGFNASPQGVMGVKVAYNTFGRTARSHTV